MPSDKILNALNKHQAVFKSIDKLGLTLRSFNLIPFRVLNQPSPHSKVETATPGHATKVFMLFFFTELFTSAFYQMIRDLLFAFDEIVSQQKSDHRWKTPQGAKAQKSQGDQKFRQKLPKTFSLILSPLELSFIAVLPYANQLWKLNCRFRSNFLTASTFRYGLSNFLPNRVTLAKVKSIEKKLRKSILD